MIEAKHYTAAKNDRIEMYRILFTLLIIVHHFQNSYDLKLVSYGWIAVDFFFILSGYFLGESLGKAISLFAYLKNRIMRLYPCLV